MEREGKEDRKEGRGRMDRRRNQKNEERKNTVK